MKSTFTAGLTTEEASHVKTEYLGSPLFRKRLQELLNDKAERMRKERLKDSAYDSPNWGFQQADSVGYQRAISEIISLIS